LKTTIISIPPQTHIRATKNTRWLFIIPEHKLSDYGLKRKKRIERYNQYKRDLKFQYEALALDLSDGKFKVVFYIPLAKSYRPKRDIGEIERSKMNNAPHKRKPDYDNLLKAFGDAIFENDSFIWSVHCEKRWTTDLVGRIEVTI
jgi:Holliday junction resolvase RusA-like endonuclease